MAGKKDKKPLIKINWLKLSIVWAPRIAIGLLLIEFGYVLGLMPDWDQFIYGPIQKSRVMHQYQYDRTLNSDWPSLDWRPLDMKKIPDALSRAVTVAEDARFYQHKGFDQEAIKNAIEYNLKKGRLVYGASTISQQTIKNFALSHSRDPLRKLHEIILTYFMERNVGKERILEIYLNIAEFGRGIYGVEAAAQFYFSRSVDELNREQFIELAATLPAPVQHNPQTRTGFFIKRCDKIRRHLEF